MEGLSGYGSESESDNESPIKTNENNDLGRQILSSKVPSNLPKTKKLKSKTLDISLLPPEIQLALRRGDSLDDSDDENFDVKHPKVNSSEYLSQSKPKSSDLLNLLPKPSTNNNNNQSNSIISTIVPQKQEDLISSKPIVSGNSTNLIPKTIDSDSGTGSESESESESESNKTISSTDSTNQNYIPSTIKINPISTKPFLIPSFSRVQPIPSTHSIQPTPMIHMGPSLSHPSPSPSLPSQSDYEDSFQQSNLSSSSSGMTNLQQKRKREKEIEQELLQGNTSSIEQYTPLDISAPNHNWNPDEYSLQLKKEVEIYRSFNIGTGSGSIQQATKVQHRRHQINSLAMRAAETELKLLEVTGNRLKTKSETQAKYGW